MRALSPEKLLEVWEAGFAQAPTQRAMLLLSAACPETPAEAAEALSVGTRDARLLALREELWGRHMEAVVACPSCRERLELNLDAHQMLASAPPAQQGEIPLSTGGYELILRLPTSRDFIKLRNQGDANGLPMLLIRELVQKATHKGDIVDTDKLPDDVVAAIARTLVEADPLADIQLRLSCPSCNHRWSAVFDIVSFLWAEIEAWAWRILTDVHILARAYGWGEREILALSPTHRQFYLDMVGA